MQCFLGTNEYLKIPVIATIFSILWMLPIILFSQIVHRLIAKTDLAASAYLHLTTGTLMCAFRAPMAYFVTFKTMRTDAHKLHKQKLRKERLEKEMKNAYRSRRKRENCKVDVFTITDGIP